MNNIPYLADYKNAFPLSPKICNVSTDMALTEFFKKKLLEKAISVFSWKMPINWSKEYFLYSLYCLGHVAIIKTDKFGVIPQHCDLSGYSVMYQPNIAIITNPLLSGGERLVIDEQCVIFKLRNDYCGIMDIVAYYAELMALASSAMGVNLINSKLSYVFGADNKAVAESFKTAANKVYNGEPFVVVDSKLVKDDGRFTMAFFQQNLKQNFISQELLEVLQKLGNMFMTEIGIPNSNTQKKERMIVDEVNANNLETAAGCDMWLENLKTACLKVEKMFDINIEVDWRYSPYKRGVSSDNI